MKLEEFRLISQISLYAYMSGEVVITRTSRVYAVGSTYQMPLCILDSKRFRQILEQVLCIFHSTCSLPHNRRQYKNYREGNIFRVLSKTLSYIPTTHKQSQPFQIEAVVCEPCIVSHLG